MKRGRPLAELSLTTRQREELIGWTRRSTMSQALALRARIILACARTTSNAEVAEALRVSRHTVGKWRKRFSTQGVDGLFDGPRPGTPRQIGRASCRERAWQYVEIEWVAVSVKKKHTL